MSVISSNTPSIEFKPRAFPFYSVKLGEGLLNPASIQPLVLYSSSLSCYFMRCLFAAAWGKLELTPAGFFRSSSGKDCSILPRSSLLLPCSDAMLVPALKVIEVILGTYINATFCRHFTSSAAMVSLGTAVLAG